MTGEKKYIAEKTADIQITKQACLNTVKNPGRKPFGGYSKFETRVKIHLDPGQIPKRYSQIYKPKI